jgi:hypothetical protein
MAERPRRWPFGVARTFKNARLRRVRRALIKEPDFHEVLVDAGSLEDSLVASHWVVYVPRLLELLAGVLFLGIVPLSSPDSAWLPLLIGAGLIAHASWRSYVVFMDVLVITEIRIFRITGVPLHKRASMPLSRVLDITVDRPLLGAILHFGHITFESAAQTQGMKDVRYVPDPFYWEKLILYHVHASNSRSTGGGAQAKGSSK